MLVQTQTHLLLCPAVPFSPALPNSLCRVSVAKGGGDGRAGVQGWGISHLTHYPWCKRETEGGSELINMMMGMEWETEGENRGERGK